MKENGCGIFNSEINDDIYIIGDIHGDYECLLHCLIDLAKCCEISETKDNKQTMKWINKNNSYIIFTGDLIHRKRFNHVMDDECSDVLIINELLRLKMEAINNGGNIIIIAGNHEIMNIMYPDNEMYISPLNVKLNFENFTNKDFINKYIENSYAWVKLNDILLVHGGLCSKYMEYVEKKVPDKKGQEIINCINIKYKEYFLNFDYLKNREKKENYDLFEYYELNPNSLNHNMFWCRQWGYCNIDCDELTKLLSKLDCKKMVVAHCPQFLNPDKPQTISFKCKSEEGFNLARIDLGMSRAFDYNCYDNGKEIKKNNINCDELKTFLKYLEFNFNRKIQILKLINKNNNLNFNYSSIITEKLSCIQYLLLKYGIRKKECKKNGFDSNWIGFILIEEFIKHMKNKKNNKNSNTKEHLIFIETLLYETINKKNKKKKLNSIFVLLT